MLAGCVDRADSRAKCWSDAEEMKPYKIVEESETHVTYEYRTAYTWTLYAALLLMVAGFVMPNQVLTIVGGAAIAAYFLAKLALGDEVTSRIRKALQVNTVQISGNKASFVNPLRVRLPK
jgi:hypothetical protein